MRTLYVLTHSTPTSSAYCECCGYPKAAGLRCVSATLCVTRRDWVGFVLSLFKLENTLISRQLVWERFIEAEVSLPPKSVEQGRELLAAKDLESYERHRKVTREA